MARKAGLPSAFALLKTAVQCWRRQPVLWCVLLWFIIVPSIAINTGARAATIWSSGEDFTFQSLVSAAPSEMSAIPWILFVVLTVWAVCCTLLVGKRLLGNPAGRGRESFRTLARQGKRQILPLILCALIREIFTIILLLPFLIASFLMLWKFPILPTNPDQLEGPWMLPQYMLNSLIANIGAVPTAGLLIGLVLLLLPSIIYRIRTTFYDVALVGEKLGCRKSLKRSADVVRGRLLPVTLRVAAVGLTVFVPLMFAITIGMMTLPPLFSDFVTDGLGGGATILLTLSSAALFRHLR